jgi:hypothetical protein
VQNTYIDSASADRGSELLLADRRGSVDMGVDGRVRTLLLLAAVAVKVDSDAVGLLANWHHINLHWLRCDAVIICDFYLHFRAWI